RLYLFTTRRGRPTTSPLFPYTTLFRSPVRPRSRPGKQGGVVVPLRLRARGVPGRGPVRRLTPLHPQGALGLGRRHPADRTGRADRPARAVPRRNGHHPRLTAAVGVPSARGR